MNVVDFTEIGRVELNFHCVNGPASCGMNCKMIFQRARAATNGLYAK